MRKRICTLLIVILMFTLTAPTAFAAERQTGSTWYPASGGWETAFKYYPSRVSQAVLVPFTVSNSMDPDELRSFLARVQRERNSDTTVNLTLTDRYSGTAYSDAKSVTPGIYTLCFIYYPSGYTYEVVDVQSKITVKSGTIKTPDSKKDSDNQKTTDDTKTTGKKIAATKLTLNKTSLTIKAGKKATLKVTKFKPTNVNPKTIKWSTSNNKIATVSSKGVVKGIKKGTATITAKSWNGKAVKCKVKVK